ncbi:swr complex subunit [Mortierella sp. AM989]|nr:swr complex subunit [Mortierella sp. AM989]
MAKRAEEKKPPKSSIESDSDSSDDEDYVPDGKFFVLAREGEEDSDDSDTEQHNIDYDGEHDLTSTRSGRRRGGASDGANRKHQMEDPVNHAEAMNKKSRIDALWADLNAPMSKPVSRPELLTAAASSSSFGSNSKPETSSSAKMITITTTYDFAGETVTVTKDVPEDSKEAKDFARKNKGGNAVHSTLGSTGKSEPDQPSFSTSIPAKKKMLSTTENDSTLSTNTNLTPDSSDSTTASTTGSATSTPTTTTAAITTSFNDSRDTNRPSILDSNAQKSRQVRYVRKKSTLDELAATYGVKKPPKLNTLEKSKLDWKNFVGKEGIEDELKHHNKDGYMEKVAFLQRTDERRDIEYQMLKKKR